MFRKIATTTLAYKKWVRNLSTPALKLIATGFYVPATLGFFSFAAAGLNGVAVEAAHGWLLTLSTSVVLFCLGRGFLNIIRERRRTTF
jgi:ABC-type Na+ efflux pump permease subunit